MSRWIDADALKEDVARLHVLNDEAEIRRAYEYNPHVTSTDFEETLVSVFDAIDDAPSIDIVRCKECRWLRYCETEDLDLYLDCDKPDGGGIPQNEDWFCADGEREGE